MWFIEYCLSILYYFCSLNKTDDELDYNILIDKNSFLIKAPEINNLAYPDFNSIYFVTFLPKNQKIRYKYKGFDNTIFVSLTIYNNLGQIIEYNDNKTDNENYTTTEYCVSIIRIYYNDRITFNVVTKKNNDTFNYIYKFLISFKKVDINTDISGFRCTNNNTNLYFCNNRAKYLVNPITNKEIVIITGKKNKEALYCAFMVCNINTETDDCISLNKIDEDYTIFVAKKYKIALNYGYDTNNKTHCLLIWNHSNKTPIIIYRELSYNILGQKFFEQQELKKIMGEYYPICT